MCSARSTRSKEERGQNRRVISMQLETLLSHESRLAQENLTYASENRFLRETVHFYQFTTQDNALLDDEGTDVGI
ncbi:hypothetical protein BDA96_08G029000 [Sorghum bicolor]|uniref:Uncharacterized protein n=1 Tax=Sorghum bicolor TaxID=4558 RepID=A0A921U6A2_SORBI|nr:hypothetical protein BDA96_08G029000 [Sorghum bicolor]